MSRHVGIGNALISGVQGFRRGRQNRQAAQDRQASQDQKLKESQARINNLPSQESQQEAMDLEIEKLRNQNAKLTADTQRIEGEIGRGNFNRAMDASQVNGNFKPLVQVLKNDPLYKKLYSPLASMQYMNPNDDSDLSLLEPARQEQLREEQEANPELAAVDGQAAPGDKATPVGNVADDFDAMRKFWEDRPGLLSQTVKNIGIDGSEEAMDLREFKFRNGYYSKMDKNQLSAEVDKTQERSAAIKLQRDELALSRVEQGLTATPTQGESDINNVATLTESTPAAVAAKREITRTAGKGAGALERGLDAKQNLYDSFGGEKEFFNTDFSDPDNRARAANDIARLEKGIGGIDKDTRKRLANMGRLLGLAKTASGGLTESATGLVDSFSTDIKGFINDKVVSSKQEEARAALRQFQALMRHEITGAALTGNELELDKKAVGRLGEKLGPLLSKFKQQVGQLRDELSSVSDLEDQTLSYFYLGKPKKEVDGIVNNLNRTLTRLGAKGLPEDVANPDAKSAKQTRREARRARQKNPNLSAAEKKKQERAERLKASLRRAGISSRSR